MAELPELATKPCDLSGCTARFRPRGRRRFCDGHRDRPWLELSIVRADAGLTVRELAQRSGILSTYIHHLEQGQRFPSNRHIRLLAAAAQVPPAQLVPRAGTVIPPHLLGQLGPIDETLATA